MPDDLPHLLQQIDESAAKALGAKLGAMYGGFVENVNKQHLSIMELQEAKTNFLMAFWAIHRTIEKNEDDK